MGLFDAHEEGAKALIGLLAKSFDFYEKETKAVTSSEFEGVVLMLSCISMIEKITMASFRDQFPQHVYEGIELALETVQLDLERIIAERRK